VKPETRKKKKKKKKLAHFFDDGKDPWLVVVIAVCASAQVHFIFEGVNIVCCGQFDNTAREHIEIHKPQK